MKLYSDTLGNKNFRHRYGHILIIYGFLLLLMLIVTIWNDRFFSGRNLKNLVLASFPLLMVAFGQTLVILTGGIDLSLGAIVALCNVTCVTLMSAEGVMGYLPAVAVTLALGAVCGALNGIVITRGRLAPIIVTIATTAIFEGAALFILPKPGGIVNSGFARFLTGGLSGLLPSIIALLILLYIRSLTNSTPFGNALRAVGGNENAAYSTGIRIGRVKLLAYITAGILCAVAGVFLTAQMYSGDATIGKTYSMNAITAAVVGGTAMSGAVGDPLGTVAGVFIISVINNMLNLWGVSSFYQFVLQGGILIVALSLSALRRAK